MTRAALVRLVAFVLVIAGSFGTAYGMGRRLPGNPESKPHTFSFGGTLSPGTYRLFLQFGYHGEVRTVPFTVVQP